MHHVAGAGYCSGNRQGCLRGTRKDVLRQINTWLTDERDQRLFWLNGLAGTGKSTIAQTFAETSFSDGKLGASFFCSRDFEDRSNIQNIFPTLAFQLAYRYPEFRKELLPILGKNPEVGRDSLCSQLEKLIIGPFKTTKIPTLIIIDALDECKDEEPASAILSILSRYIDQIPRVKLFITGRPEARVRTGFRLELLRPITEVLKLHEVERASVDDDIKLFFKARLGDIAKTRSDCDLTEDWPSTYDIDFLCKKAAGLFIYAATVVKFVASPYDLPTERLTLIISLRHSTAHEGKSGVDLLYTQVLEQAFRDADSDAQELYSRFKLTVGAVLLVFYPLSRKTISELLKNCGTPSRISNSLRSLHSLLLVPTSEADPIRTFHKSFPDFLTDPRRCKDERFFVNPPDLHTDILLSCLDLMKERLAKNICELEGCPTLSDVHDLPARRERHIGSALEYACRFWAKHLAEVPSSGPHVKQVQELVDEFFTMHLLFWIEVLSLTGNLSLGVYALHEVNQWYLSVSRVRYLSEHALMCIQTGIPCKWTTESQRLILFNFDEIYHSPTKIYRDVLPFCPSSSWLHQWYTAEHLQVTRVVRGHLEEWGTCSRAVSFERSPKALVHRKDFVAVGLISGEIVILDPITGSRRSTLFGRMSGATSLSLSLDGSLLVSGGSSSVITLWDTQTGGVVKTLTRPDGGYGAFRSVSISPDAITVAAGYRDETCLWDVRTGKASSIRTGRVTHAEFLQMDPRRLMTVSTDGFVQRWDMKGRKVGGQIHGRHIAFSLDGNRFVLCGGGAPTVRDTRSTEIITTLHSPCQDFTSCCFSPSGESVAGVAKATIYIWTLAGTHSTPPLIGTFTPHKSIISSLLYSSSFISAHTDNKIRFCQIGDDFPNSATASTKASTTRIGDIVCIALGAKEGSAVTIDSDGRVTLWDLSTGLPTTLPRAFKPSGFARCLRLVHGVLTIVSYISGPPEVWEISTWDIETGSNLRTTQLSTAPDYFSDLNISEDGTSLFSMNSKGIETWSTTTGKHTGPIEHKLVPVERSPAIALGGQIDPEGLWHRQWYVCDLNPAFLETLNTPYVQIVSRTVELPPGLSGRNLTRYDFALIWGHMQAPSVCGQGGITYRPRKYTPLFTVKDISSKTRAISLPNRFTRVRNAQWDGRYLFADCDGGEVLILDLAHTIIGRDP